MASHQQLLYHIVFSTKDRCPLLKDDHFREGVWRCMAGVAQQSVVKFHWQDGYGAFTVSSSKVDAVVAYIDRQMEHHSTRTFQDEYLKMLADHEVEYDAKYLWE